MGKESIRAYVDGICLVLLGKTLENLFRMVGYWDWTQNFSNVKPTLYYYNVTRLEPYDLRMKQGTHSFS